MRRNGKLLGLGTRWNVYDGPGPEGVPNPYVPQIELYPSYVHGADYTRPVFSMPFYRNPYNVLNGLGATAEEALVEAEGKSLSSELDQQEAAIFGGALAGALALGALGAIIGGIAAPPHRNAGSGILIGAIGGGLLGLIPAAVGAGFAVAITRKKTKP